jgi:hypothetical protein
MASSAPLRLAHIPTFRSTRVVWLYHELQRLYPESSSLPPLEIHSFPDVAAFRAHKPEWLLAWNPNGKVPSLSHGDIHLFEVRSAIRGRLSSMSTPHANYITSCHPDMPPLVTPAFHLSSLVVRAGPSAPISWSASTPSGGCFPGIPRRLRPSSSTRTGAPPRSTT